MARSLIATATLALAAGAAAQHAAAPSFARDVLPLLQRQGCSSAYCHGSATGRGGFRLSLFGSDADADWRALAVDLAGRRIDVAHPEQSLVLQKPSRQLPHAGGLRLPQDGPAWQRIRDWIARGAPREPDLGPPTQICAERRDGAVIVHATFDDGTQRDVTDCCTFASTDERVVTVDPLGATTLRGSGEAFVTARYAGRDAIVRVVAPCGDLAAVAPPGGHPADVALADWLGELGLTMAPLADRTLLARRLWLDLLGHPPAPYELDGFVADDRADGELLAATADALMRRDGFAERWGGRLAAWFEVPDPTGAPAEQGVRLRGLRQLLRDAVATDVRLDELAGQLLVPGHAYTERVADPRDRAELLARAVLGVRVGCARCHDHPNDHWRRRDHLGLAALVATRRDHDGEIVRGSVYDEATGAAVTPRMPSIDPSTRPAGAATAETADDLYAPLRRAALAPGGPFARNVANRVLGALLSRAPVEPPDDHRLTNPPVAGPLLAAVTAEYERTHGDLRGLLRFVITSRAYRVDSAPDAGDVTRDRLRERHLARRSSVPLDGARVATSLAFVTGAPAPAGLPDSPLARALALQGGAALDAALAAPGNPVDAIADLSPDPDVALRELMLLVLSRPPRPAEQAALRPRLRAATLRGDLRELAAALCLCREFQCLR